MALRLESCCYPTAQAHRAAGMQKLEALRRQFLAYLERKEQEVQRRAIAGRGGQEAAPPATDLSEWLS